MTCEIMERIIIDIFKYDYQPILIKNVFCFSISYIVIKMPLIFLNLYLSNFTKVAQNRQKT